MNRRIFRAMFPPHSLPGSIPSLQARQRWHVSQHKARVAHTQRDGWYEGTPASHAVTLPPSPLHTQWLSSPLTPWEYQHLVRRHWERRTFGVEAQAELDALELAEHDFLYRESAPCGAD